MSAPGARWRRRLVRSPEAGASDSGCAEARPSAGAAASTALVTGAASGIGLAVARLLLEEGWRVLLADADAAALAALRDDPTLADAARAQLLRLDVTDEAAVARAVQDIPADRPLKAVVNSAGIGHNLPFEQTSVELLRRIVDVNLVGTFIVCQAAARAMRAAGGGAIVNISSGSGLRANAGRAAYGASKAAVEMLSKVMAVELAPLGIRVNTVAPGPIETPLVARMHGEADRRAALATVPLRRYGRPQDVARAVAFLLDERSSSFVSGETLCVDGGFAAAGAFVHPASG